MLLSSSRLTLTSGMPCRRRSRPPAAGPAVAEAAQRVGHQVAADDVDHDVDAPAAGELLDGVAGSRRPAPPRRRRARRANVGLLLGGDHGDGAGAVPLARPGGWRCRRRRRRRAPAPSRPRGPGRALERELRGQVVHRQRGALLEAHRVGQREHRRRGAPATRSAAAAVRQARRPPGRRRRTRSPRAPPRPRRRSRRRA